MVAHPTHHTTPPTRCAPAIPSPGFSTQYCLGVLKETCRQACASWLRYNPTMVNRHKFSTTSTYWKRCPDILHGRPPQEITILPRNRSKTVNSMEQIPFDAMFGIRPNITNGKSAGKSTLLWENRTFRIRGFAGEPENRLENASILGKNRPKMLCRVNSRPV